MRLMLFMMAGWWLATAAIAAEPSCVIRFHRPARVGQELACRFQVVGTTKTVRVQADEREVETTASLGLELVGIMRVVTVTPAGQTATATFAVTGGTAREAGKEFIPAYVGQTLAMDFTRLPTCEIRIVGEGAPALTEAELRLLGLVFRPASGETLAELLGREWTGHEGESWPLATAGLLRRLTALGLVATPAQVSGTATLRGRPEVAARPCWEVAIEIATRDLPGYGFLLTMAIWLPMDERHGVIRLERYVCESLRRPLAASEPLAVNLRELRVEQVERLTAELIPQEEITQRKEPPP